ncbi:MAG TPA: chemotaxis protein CheA [Desulfuromonadales bacterium]|nr:chemotaxis protein CheA [Desulfuromonadales bacterium]
MSEHGSAAYTKAIRDFLAEAEEIVEQLATELADLFDSSAGGELNPDLLNSIFRGAHSLKGLAGMFGFSDISELSHTMENLLDMLRLGKRDIDQPVITVLIDAQELLAKLVAALATGDSTGLASEITACVARINACLAPSEEKGASSPLESLGLSAQVLSSLTEYEEHRLIENISKGRTIFNVHASFDLSTFDQELTRITELLKSCGEVVSTLPSIGANMETHIDFDMIMGSTSVLADIENLLKESGVTITELGRGSAPATSLPPVVPCKDSPADLLTVAAPVPKPSSTEVDAADPLQNVLSPSLPLSDTTLQSAKSMSRTVRVDIGKLDELMNIVGELVLSNSAIADITVKMRTEGFSRISIELGKAAKALERKLTELQKGVIEIRMIPVGQLYEKLSRIVRKISREQGKKVDLKFYGADTELDKLIIEDISDPMMHIIRNAIDHGIESQTDRVARGKSEAGTIRISSSQKGNHVVIEVEDDGNGIDVEKVKNIALRKGLVSDISNVRDRDALDFIFLPGFSTSDTVSEVSGRGVGMDVVKNNITALSGMVDIETRPGHGSRFIITLPITLAIIKALIVSCSGRMYALPITSVLESLILKNSDITTIERKEVIQVRETTLPLLRLESFFDLKGTSESPSEYYVVVVGIAEKRLGIVVDDLLCQQDIVIKPLGDSFSRLHGIAGAADLGDQRTILVLDVGGIINETIRSGS